MSNPEKRVAQVQANAAACLVEGFGMMSENMQRGVTGASMAYTEGDFAQLIEKYRIEPDLVKHLLQL